jgi:hypothetical protein
MVLGAMSIVAATAFAADPAERSSDQAPGTPDPWMQSYGRHDTDCLEWTDTCVNCLRSQPGADYACSNIGIACQPKEIKCVKRAVPKTE